MNKNKKLLFFSAIVGSVIGIKIHKETKKRQKKAWAEERHIPYGPYEALFKRPLDFLLSGIALIVLCPVLLVIALMVRIKLGSPVVFSQLRPGLNEKLFKLHKFRSMVDLRDKNGNPLSDEIRLTDFGKKLRETSLDEFLELVDVFIGNMSIVGPRPQLVRDMVFMSKAYRKRHEVMPGLTGLAQINGRNAIDWEKKLTFDIEYINKITLLGDIKIIFKSIGKVFVSREGITEQGLATAMDYGDYLLKNEKINYDEYKYKQEMARKIIHNI